MFKLEKLLVKNFFQKSLRLVLQSKSVYDENWMNRIEIDQEDRDYHLLTGYEEIFIEKNLSQKMDIRLLSVL